MRLKANVLPSIETGAEPNPIYHAPSTHTNNMNGNSHWHQANATIPDIRQGDARDLSFLPEASIDLIVTSPPYWLRRNYGHPEQLGQEATPEAYIDALIGIMNGWARLLRPHAS